MIDYYHIRRYGFLRNLSIGASVSDIVRTKSLQRLFGSTAEFAGQWIERPRKRPDDDQKKDERENSCERIAKRLS